MAVKRTDQQKDDLARSVLVVDPLNFLVGRMAGWSVDGPLGWSGLRVTSGSSFFSSQDAFSVGLSRRDVALPGSDAL